ncbi:MAG: 16S rRNA (uracil(1498)-N(3))-methyltransferase [Flavobacteriales bacterium]|nr:16S rRNA (uracil(1498)-N(3))-methyltransferase [Flavobacteriales bacterium]
MHSFYCPALDSDLIELPEEEAHHAVHVLRLVPGDRIALVNGKGMRAEGSIITAAKGRCTAQVNTRSHEPRERESSMHLAVATTKQQERMEWLMEKAVEIGIDRFTPVITARTERSRLRTDRLLRVAIAAMKQSQRAWLPRIDEPMPLSLLLDEQLPAQRFFGWCEEKPETLMHAYRPQADAIILIGPEGDFDPNEAARLKQQGLAPVGLGTARLRTETAALAAITWMSLAQQR